MNASEDRPVPVMPQAVVGLTAQVDELIDRLDVMEERRRMDRRILYSGIALVVALVFVAGAIGAVGLYISGQNRSTLDAVNDCTQPGGECYERGQRSTSKAIEYLVKVNIAVHACRLEPAIDTEAELDVCVQRELAEP